MLNPVAITILNFSSVSVDGVSSIVGDFDRNAATPLALATQISVQYSDWADGVFWVSQDGPYQPADYYLRPFRPASDFTPQPYNVDRIIGTSGNDEFYMHSSKSLQISAGDGDDFVSFGMAYDAPAVSSVRFDGGAGINAFRQGSGPSYASEIRDSLVIDLEALDGDGYASVSLSILGNPVDGLTDYGTHIIGYLKNVQNLAAWTSPTGGEDQFTGNDAANRFETFAGDDALKGNGGDDYLDAGAGVDTAIYRGSRADYDVTAINDVAGPGFRIQHLRNITTVNDGDDRVYGVEFFAFSDGVLTAVQLLPPNTPPAVSGDLDATVLEGGVYTLTTSDLSFIDPDDVANGVTFRVRGLTNGSLNVRGVAANPAAGQDITFTAQDVSDGLVTFVHDGSDTPGTGFSVTVEDGNEDGSAPPVPSPFTFTVTPINDAPTDILISNQIASLLENTFTRTEIAHVFVEDPDILAEFRNNPVAVNDDRFVVENGILYLLPNKYVNFESASSIPLLLSSNGIQKNLWLFAESCG